MNQLSARDALEKLKARILDSIKRTEEVILNAASNGNYLVAADLRSETWGRKSIVYMIDEMLDELKTSS